MLASPSRRSALHHGELLWTLVDRQLRLRAKRSLLGLVWPLVAPLCLLGLYGVVFGTVFDVAIDDYGIYLLAGLLPWTFLVQGVHDSLQSISFEPELVRRAPFPYHLLPLARVVVMAIPFAALLVGFIAYLGVAGRLDLAALAFLVVPLASLALVVSTACVLVALVDVFNRDLRYVLNNLLTVWFFLVPIVYQRRMAGEWLQGLNAVDPMARIVAGFHDGLYRGTIGDPFGQLLTLAGCAALFGAGLAGFRRVAVDLAKDV